MPTPDPTGFNAVRAGDYATADTFHANHPFGFNQTMQSSALFAAGAYRGASASSNTITTGTKLFTLTETRGWQAGDPVYITQDGSPTDRKMVGVLTADETSEGVITCNITSIDDSGGAGPWTLWTIRLIDAATTVVAPPLGIASGGTGASTPAGARTTLVVGRTFRVISILSTPPGTPNSGDRYLVGQSPTGAWSTFVNKVVEYNGSSWVATTATAGDKAFDALLKLEYIHKGVASNFGALWVNSLWAASDQSGVIFKNIGLPDQLVKEDFSGDDFFRVLDGGLGPFNFTLPDDVSTGARITVYNGNLSNSLTLNVANGKQIDGLASFVIASGSKAILFTSDTPDPLDRWVVVSLYP